MNEESEVEKLRRRYLRFAEFEAKGNSPTYWSFTTAVADNERILELLAILPKEKQQPNLLLAAVRLQYGVPKNPREFCDLVISHWDEIRTVVLNRSTQTNEPARCATLLPVMADLAQPIALLEVGTSAGLCLFPDHYAYDYGGVRLLPTDEVPPTFMCHANRRTPIPSRLPEVSWRGGIDVRPLSVSEEADMNWLRLLVWPDQTDRLDNLNQAIKVAQRNPPRIVEGDLLMNLEALASVMPADATSVVFHSATLAYLPRSERERFVSMVSALDVIWVSNEHPAVFPGISSKMRSEVPQDRFLLSVNGDPVAITGPHGQSVDWL